MAKSDLTVSRKRKRKPSKRRRDPAAGPAPGRARIGDAATTRVGAVLSERDHAAFHDLLARIQAADPRTWAICTPDAEKRPRRPRAADLVRLVVAAGLPVVERWFEEEVEPLADDFTRAEIDRELEGAVFEAFRSCFIRGEVGFGLPVSTRKAAAKETESVLT